ncbi:MAG: hypothetical protein A2W93_13315 [Bacteroidetes bacterium GWF2_43_63]|nr:MAG: hypothetical protein A2W94_03295 [Bacteroidetes bacterium GWE2_42_42]OFY55160.1 MAG: hypothetical protein A2W93_13315 [Bacteroidetes bacterium GWF2_43_63]HBG70218.1 hypothetical protein [Bacteroidales bacterium]HCB63109.1 hypothetical protein [Bacteroidales bacterium]HCY22672.1 hypothetical protein [Bacteroidales bacterium]
MTLKEIKNKTLEIAEIINASPKLLPTFGHSVDGAHPHIESDSRGLHYLIIERGQELDRKTTTEIDELMFWIFNDVTFNISTQYELENRVKNKDCRRLMFSKQEELLGLINNDWKVREQKNHESILIRHPFDDFSSIRADFTKELRDSGMDNDIAWKKACDKYPLP